MEVSVAHAAVAVGVDHVEGERGGARRQVRRHRVEDALQVAAADEALVVGVEGAEGAADGVVGLLVDEPRRHRLAEGGELELAALGQQHVELEPRRRVAEQREVRAAELVPREGALGAAVELQKCTADRGVVDAGEDGVGRTGCHRGRRHFSYRG